VPLIKSGEGLGEKNQLKKLIPNRNNRIKTKMTSKRKRNLDTRLLDSKKLRFPESPESDENEL
jgi:hypothetical protein